MVGPMTEECGGSGCRGSTSTFHFTVPFLSKFFFFFFFGSPVVILALNVLYYCSVAEPDQKLSEGEFSP